MQQLWQTPYKQRPKQLAQRPPPSGSSTSWVRVCSAREGPGSGRYAQRPARGGPPGDGHGGVTPLPE
eukprot:3177416-Prorocentrum_lima.AAC.1